MKSKVVLIITAANCKSCVRFKNSYAEETKRLLKDKGAEVVSIEYARVGGPMPKLLEEEGRGRELSKFILWFPIILMIDSKTYNNKKIPLSFSNVDVYGLIIDKKTGKRKANTQISYLPSSVISWFNVTKNETINVPIMAEPLTMLKSGVPPKDISFRL